MNKKYINLLIGILIMVVVANVPFLPLTKPAMQIIGIFLGTLYLWLLEGIDYPSLMLIVLLGMVDGIGYKNVLINAFGNSTFIFLMFTFVLTYALSKTTLIERIAYYFINSKLAKKGPWCFVMTYFLAIMFIGLFTSPTVLFSIFLAILTEMLEILKIEKGEKSGKMFMMGTVIMCAISSGMTPIAHVFPLIGMGLYQDMYGISISYMDFMFSAIPIGLISFAFMMFIFRFILRPDLNKIDQTSLKSVGKVLPKLKKQEKVILMIFLVTVALWVLPSVLKPIISDGILLDVVNKIDEWGIAFPAMIACVILCIIEIDGKPILTIFEGLSKGVSWPSLIMCAATLAIGSALTDADFGITAYISETIGNYMSDKPELLMVIIFVLWAAIQTNLSSNMVTATLVSTSVLTITASMNINVKALIILVGITASYAYMTPPAMPSVALAISSEYVNTKDMFLNGLILMIFTVLLASVVFYPIM